MFDYYINRLPKEALPHKLDRKRIFIFPSKLGLIFIVMIFTMFLVSLNSKNNFGFLATFFLISIFIISIFYTFYNIYKLEIKSITCQAVYAGQLAEFEINISGNKFIHPNLNLYISKNYQVTVNINNQDPVKAILVTPVEKRGIYIPKKITIATSYPFGLLTAWSYYRPVVECIVYPKPLDYGAEYLHLKYNEQLSQGQFIAKGNQDLSHLRDYQQGDNLSVINWKSAAKGKGLQTKEFESEQGGYFEFDINKIQDSDLEIKLSKLAGLILKANMEQTSYSLNLTNNKIPVGSGKQHLQDCLKALAIYKI